MKFLLRLDGGASAPLSLEAQVAEDAKIGELADHLANLIGLPNGLTIEGHRREDHVSSRGPRSGTTVRLVKELQEEAQVALAPVVATPTTPAIGVSPDSGQLCFGSNDVGGVLVHVAERVEVRSTSSTIPLVNGQRVLGSRRITSGDLVTLNSDATDSAAFAIHITGPLEPPAIDGPQIAHRTTRRSSPGITPLQLDLPTPPDPVRLPGFPVLSAVVPLLMGAGLWLATRSVASSVFIIFSFVYVLASGLEARREARADERFRLEQFREDLDEIQNRISKRHEEEDLERSDECPPSIDLIAMVLSHSERIWERNLDDSNELSLTVRLGRGLTATATTLTLPHGGRRDLRRELETIVAENGRAELPLTVNLDSGGGLGLIGRGEVTTDVARWVLAQLASLIAPDELRIVVLCDPLRQQEWAWSSWLPHVQQDGMKPRTVVVVDGADDTDVEATLSLLPPDSTRLLWLSPTRAGIPKRLRQVFELGDSPVLHLVADHLNPRASDGVDQAGTPYIGTEQIPVEPRNVEDLTDDQVVPLARSLAPLVPRRSPLDRVSTDPASGGGARLGDILAERDMLTSADSVRRQWKASRSHSGLDAPVGRAGHGVLHLDLKVDGPHALVAGTTGSGKSEFLRSLVASMALHHGPDRLTFLLVDYKGGAAFNSLDRLPHSVGMITDLGPDLAERALISLRAEVLRREKVLASLGLVDLNEAFSEEPGAADGPTLQVPPSLVVVVDEFATLARELPDFVDGLVDIAQRGRSLGIHLILATQRPAGVVTDSIRANTSLRIALRVADPDDSTDVVDSPDAAQLPRTSPGQALVKIGSNPPVHVQFAYSAESSRRPPRVLTRPLGPGPIASQIAGLEATSCAELPAGGAKNDSTELSLAIAVANSAAVAAEIAQPIRPWVPPLPESLGLESIDKYVTHLSDLGSSLQDSLVVGIADRPSRQRIDPLTVDLSACGGALILGAGGSGKSTTLATIAQAGSQCGTTHTYLIGSRQGVFADPLSSDLQPAALSDVIELSDAERTLRLLHSAVGLILDQRRTGEPRSAGLLILLDDYSAFEQFHERINRGEALDLLTRIAREGRSAGVHIAVTAQRRIEVPPTLASNLGLQIFLRCTSEDEASVLGLSPNAASSDLPAGRGYVKGDLVQIALPTLRSCVAGTTGAGSTGAGSTGSDSTGAGSTGAGSTGADSTGDRAPDSTNAPVMDSHRSLTGPLIRSLPEQLHLSDLALLGDDRCPENKIGHASIATPQSVWSSLLVGLNGDDLSVAELDLEHSHLVVAGPRRSGRSTTLALLASALELASSKHSQSRQPSERRRSAAFGLSPRPGPQTAHWTESFNTSTRPTPLAHGSDSDNGSRELDAFFQTVSATALGGTPTLLAVDDLPDLLEGPFELAIESGLAALMTVAEQAPLRLVLSGEIEAMTRSFSGTLTRVRAGRTAILIQPDPDVHGSIAHCDIPRRDELRSVPGRGWLICDSKTLPVQLAQP